MIDVRPSSIKKWSTLFETIVMASKLESVFFLEITGLYRVIKIDNGMYGLLDIISLAF